MLSQAFVCRIVRLAAAIGSRVIGWGRLTPPPPQQMVGGEISQQLPGYHNCPPPPFTTRSVRAMTPAPRSYAYGLKRMFVTTQIPYIFRTLSEQDEYVDFDAQQTTM